MRRSTPNTAIPCCQPTEPPVAEVPSRTGRRRRAGARCNVEQPDRREFLPPKPQPDQASAPAASMLDHSTQPASSDSAWLAPFPIRAQLADPTTFDRDALLWRAFQSLLPLLFAELQPTGLEREKSRTLFLAVAEGRFPYLVAYLLNTPPPQQWKVCGRCKGRGRSGLPEATCLVCEGGGFEMPIP